jgi:para-nitrobenzyl esterase
MSHAIRILLCLLLPAPTLAAVADTPSAPQVHTSAGQLAGTIEGALQVFRGIPYAAPPVGRLRWQAPQPVPGWHGVRDATRFGKRCVQARLFADMVFRSPAYGEDCLYLNVWTTQASRSARMPVLVYIHGGGFLAGDGSEPRYDGAALARQGIVTVTLNHRLGAFGFLAHPWLRDPAHGGASGNYGLMDLVAALRWVRANITDFGGDPLRVTIAGESAGSIAVSALMAAPSARGLFSGAIGESGSLLGALSAMPRAACEGRGEALAKAAGATSLAALRALSPEQLLQAGAAARIDINEPCIDGRFYAEDPVAIFAAGRQAHVPLLVGSNSQESNYDALLPRDIVPTPQAWRERLEALFSDHSGEALRVYPGGDSLQVLRSARALASDRFIALSTWKWAMASVAAGQPTWYFRFERPRPAPVVPTAATAPLLPDGATHSGEIEYALGNLAGNPVYAWTDEDRRVEATMTHYFAQFIRRGNPNGAGLPEWRDYRSGERQVIDVTSASSHDEQRAQREFLAAWQATRPPAGR